MTDKQKSLSEIRAANVQPNRGKRDMLITVDNETYEKLCNIVESGKYRSGADAVRSGLNMLIEKEGV